MIDIGAIIGAIWQSRLFWVLVFTGNLVEAMEGPRQGWSAWWRACCTVGSCMGLIQTYVTST